MIKLLLLKIVHRLKLASCSYTVINVDPLSRERKLICISCGKTEKVFYV